MIELCQLSPNQAWSGSPLNAPQFCPPELLNAQDAATIRKREKSLSTGHAFICRGRRGDIVNLLWANGNGFCLFMKHLERGPFI